MIYPGRGPDQPLAMPMSMFQLAAGYPLPFTWPPARNRVESTAASPTAHWFRSTAANLPNRGWRFNAPRRLGRVSGARAQRNRRPCATT
jgi:hypothetical protein